MYNEFYLLLERRLKQNILIAHNVVEEFSNIWKRVCIQVRWVQLDALYYFIFRTELNICVIRQPPCKLVYKHNSIVYYIAFNQKIWETTPDVLQIHLVIIDDHYLKYQNIILMLFNTCLFFNIMSICKHACNLLSKCDPSIRWSGSISIF